MKIPTPMEAGVKVEIMVFCDTIQSDKKCPM